MTSIKSRPWHDIERTYRNLVDHNWDMQPMVSLVEAIASSPYAEGTFGTTSLATLCVGQTAEFDLDRNVLRVDFAKRQFVFRYIESSFKGTAWQKECGPDEGFSTFEHVVGRLKWFLD